MSRTVFVNPSYRRRKRSKKRRSSTSNALAVREAFKLGRASKGKRRSGGRRRRRNAGIAPFVQNPLILSNPRRRRRRNPNPFTGLTLRKAFMTGASSAGGAAIALGANSLVLNRIQNDWLRRGAQLAANIIGGVALGSVSPGLGASYMGAMWYPLYQDLFANFLGMGVVAGVSAKEADLDALAADLEDVMDEMDEDIFADDMDEDEDDVFE